MPPPQERRILPNGTEKGIREISLDMLLLGGKETQKGLMDVFYGNLPGKELKRRARNREPIPAKLKRDVDTLFFNGLKEAFALPDGSDPKEFYRSSLKSANFAVTSFVERFPSQAGRIDLRNEVRAFDGPHDNLYLFCAPPDKVARKLQFEIGRQLALGYIAGALEVRSRGNGLQEKLSQLQRLFSENVYEGPVGSGLSIDTYAWHDNNTNAAIKLSADEDPHERGPYTNTHLKKHAQEVRQVSGIGSVYSDLQEKTPSSAILKVLRKAVEDKENDGSGKVNIDEAVRDMVRGKMVVLGTTDINDPRIDILIEKVKTTIEENSGTPEDPEKESLGELEYIKEKNATRGSKGQSSEVSFKRLLIKYKELPVPIELKFSSHLDELNDEFEIGTKRDDGHYDGRAHGLYEVRRLEELTEVLFPQEIYYPHEKPSYLANVARTYEDSVAKQLLASRRVPNGGTVYVF